MCGLVEFMTSSISLPKICYGNSVMSPSVKIDDANRKQYFELLKVMYSTERKFLDSQRNSGIAASAKNGNYKGRERIKLDKLVAPEIFLDYMAKRINSADASGKLGIRKSTFLRRYREYKKTRQ